MDDLTKIIVAVLAPVVSMLIGKAFAWLKAQNRVRADEDFAVALDALEVGVQAAWDQVGKRWKHDPNGDGKYTAEQRDRLKATAVEAAKVAAAARGVDLKTALAGRAVGLLIKKIVDRRKRKRGAA